MTNEFSPIRGGISTYVEGTARAAVSLGYLCEVWTYGTEHKDDHEYPFEVVRLGQQPTQNWPDRLRLASKVRGYAHCWGNVVLCLPEPGPLRMWLYQNVLALPTPMAIIPIFHGSELGLINRWPHRRKLLENLLSQSVKIGVVSDYVKSLLPQLPDIQNKVIRVPGAPLQIIPEHTTKRTRTGAFKLLSLGRIQKRKGQLSIIEALAHMPLELRNRFHLTLVGRIKDKSYLSQIRKLAKANSISYVIEGECSEAKRSRLLNESDLFLFPSDADSYRVEGLGLAVLEAAEHELPTLGSLHGGVPEAIVDGETGWLVDTSDPKKFAAKLLDLQKTPELCEQVGERAKAWVEKSFSYERNVEALFGEFF